MTSHQLTALLQGIAGAAVIAAGLRALTADAEGWNVVWYIPAWYGYLILLDALILALRGRSFLHGRLREAGAMLFWSVPFWYLFEAANLVLQNWYYVFTPRHDWAQLAMGVTAFATVFPACFVHAELLGLLGLEGGKGWKPLRVGRRLKGTVFVLGIGCLALPLLLPRQFFWAVWAAPLFIPEWLNYRRGAPSLLGDLEQGNPARMLRLLAAGLWAGGIWELFNFWARCKWIYTVPGFEEGKLFEMPLLGFLGFPVLALGAFSFYTLICDRLRGGRHWEAPCGTPRPHSRLRFWAAVVLGLAIVGTVHRAGRRNIRSMRPLLIELQALDRAQADKLGACGIPTPERLDREVRRQGPQSVALGCGLSIAAVEAAEEQASLALHKGMGAHYSRLLLEAGIRKVSDLAGQDPKLLTEDLQSLARTLSLPPPRLPEVAVWISAASPGKGPRR